MPPLTLFEHIRISTVLLATKFVAKPLAEVLLTFTIRTASPKMSICEDKKEWPKGVFWLGFSPREGEQLLVFVTK